MPFSGIFVVPCPWHDLMYSSPLWELSPLPRSFTPLTAALRSVLPPVYLPTASRSASGPRPWNSTVGPCPSPAQSYTHRGAAPQALSPSPALHGALLFHQQSPRTAAAAAHLETPRQGDSAVILVIFELCINSNDGSSALRLQVEQHFGSCQHASEHFLCNSSAQKADRVVLRVSSVM